MFCPKCGARNDDAGAACTACGAALPGRGASAPRSRDDLETYQKIAETVGGVPSLRWRDNLIQGIVIFVCTLVGAVVGRLMGGFEGMLIGALIGLVGSTLLSGFVLMILGWVRAVRKD